MTSLSRGEIYYINFPYTDDMRYPDGKKKFVLILQEGDYFQYYEDVVVLLVTTDKDCGRYPTNVLIPLNSTKLSQVSWIACAQPYPIDKSLFESPDCWCAGKVSPAKMDEVDRALFLGLCMGAQHETEAENSIPIEA